MSYHVLRYHLPHALAGRGIRLYSMPQGGVQTPIGDAGMLHGCLTSCTLTCPKPRLVRAFNKCISLQTSRSLLFGDINPRSSLMWEKNSHFTTHCRAMSNFSMRLISQNLQFFLQVSNVFHGRVRKYKDIIYAPSKHTHTHNV